MTTFRSFILPVVGLAVVAGQLPLWKNLLFHHDDWTGSYEHDDRTYTCTLTVHSLSLTAVDVAYVTFNAEHISVDMKVSAEDNRIITLRESSAWNRTAHFEHHTELEIHGEFVYDNVYYKFVGNVSSREMQDFGTVTLQPKGRPYQPRKRDDSSAFKYGLAVGIPVVLAFMLMVTAAMIMWWAIKKGYLRHIPWTYKHFTNPRRSEYEINYTQRCEQATVHM